MKVETSAHINLHSLNQNNAPQGPQQSTAALASAALREARAEALNETQENLSMNLARMTKKMHLDGAARDSMVNALEKLMDQMDKMARQGVNRVAEHLSVMKDASTMLGALARSGMSPGEMAMVLSALLTFKGLDPEIKRKLKERLSELMGDVDIELEILAAAQGVEINKESLQALRNLYQNAKRGEQGLAHWFDLLKQHEDREKYIKILIQALAEPIQQGQKKDDLTQTVATILDLRRLLLFLTFQEHYQSLARALDLDANVVASLTIEMLEQSWLYPDAVSIMINRLNLDEPQRINFLRRWKELMVVMSEDCYRDKDHKEHVVEVLIDLLHKWSDD